jgi:hypothetical protein
MPYKTDTWSMNGVASKCVPPPAVLWRLQCSCTCQSYRARGGGRRVSVIRLPSIPLFNVYSLFKRRRPSSFTSCRR